MIFLAVVAVLWLTPVLWMAYVICKFIVTEETKLKRAYRRQYVALQCDCNLATSLSTQAEFTRHMTWKRACRELARQGKNPSLRLLPTKLDDELEAEAWFRDAQAGLKWQLTIAVDNFARAAEAQEN